MHLLFANLHVARHSVKLNVKDAAVVVVGIVGLTGTAIVVVAADAVMLV